MTAHQCRAVHHGGQEGRCAGDKSKGSESRLQKSLGNLTKNSNCEGDIPQKEGGGLVSDKALIDSCASNNNWIGYHY